MLSATFHDRGVRADDPDFSIDPTWSTATIHTPENLHIICRNCYTSQGDPDSSFPYLAANIYIYIYIDIYVCAYVGETASAE